MTQGQFKDNDDIREQFAQTGEPFERSPITPLAGMSERTKRLITIVLLIAEILVALLTVYLIWGMP